MSSMSDYNKYLIIRSFKLTNMQAVSKAESQVSEAQQRLMQLEQDKAELDKQLRKTQEAVLAGKQRVEQLREEVRKRTEARTVMPRLQHVATLCTACKAKR